jgi:hypothetical protein
MQLSRPVLKKLFDYSKKPHKEYNKGRSGKVFWFSFLAMFVKKIM